MILSNVYLWGSKVGIIAQEDEHSIPKFSYDKDFISSGIELSPIVMPLSNKIYSFPTLNSKTFYLLPGLIADSLPDRYGNRLIERYLIQQGRKIEDFSIVERLLYTGKRAMGALEYMPEKQIGKTKDSSIDIDALVKLASDILSERENINIKVKNPTMEQIIKVGTSAGGMRAKAVVAWNKDTNDIRSGQIDNLEGYEYWIMKFDGVKGNVDDPETASYTKIEYAYYLMALACKINMNECRLYEENSRFHFMTKRFDRIENGQKLHMQTLGAIAHYDYNLAGEYSYEDAFWVMNKLNLEQNDIEQFYRRMVFNVIARNQDDHVKNISFLMDKKGTWTLSPAYDMTYSYNPIGVWTNKHQMLINNKSEDISMDDLLKCANYMNISSIRAKNIIKDVKEGVSSWEEFAKKAFIPKKETEEIRNNFVLL
ncbi:MAG: type II toxin-antitoxin system HipA family toxin [Candidatus Gastranaerophilales bacterium]|nr:type II toxin-antitoxin system HipA family toxin [Candidatus Gastranaerophilales bacterium]